MKTLLLGTGIVLSISCLARVGQTQAAAEQPIKWEVSAGLEAPESVYFEASSGVLFVSNIGKGGPTAKDGSGFISKLTLEGKMLEPKWVAGLNAPKGQRSHSGILWVSDIDRLVGIDIAKGEIRHKIEAEGAQFLNDVATDREGAVYVSDMLANKIYRYKEGKLSVLVEGDHLESPNGLLVQGNRLVVAGWGLGIQEDFGAQTPGRLFSLNLNGEDKRLITPEPTGNLDGVEAVNDQGYLVSDWYAGKVYFINKGGKTELLLQLPRGAADLAYLPRQRLLIVPQMLENKVSAFEFPVRGN